MAKKKTINDFQKPTLVGDKVIIEDSTLKGKLVEKGFGESKGRSLVLDLFEAAFLLSKKKIEVIGLKGKKVSKKKLLEIGSKKNKNFYSKLIVYSDIRSRGYNIKTGLKFGFDFRVYPKGKKVGQAHSIYVINVVPESERLAMKELSRMTRLAGNIHTKVLQAVVDSEDSVNYYLMERIVL